MANYLRALGYNAASSRGLGCACRRSQPLAGYVARTLRGYRAVTLSGFGDPVAPGTPALLPVSDRKAVADAIRMFQMRAAARGLGDTAQATSAAQSSATLAKVGSAIWPGVGTVIGAVVGAVVGWLGSKKPPVRPSPQQIAECKARISDYMNFAAEMPDQAIPLDKAQLLELHWCLQAIYGGHYIGVKDYRWFNPGVEAALIPAAQQLVRKIYETPVGQQVAIDTITFKDPKGRTLSFKGFSFTNPQFTNLKTFTEQVWLPMAVQYCENTAGKGAPGCAEYYRTPEFRRWLYDVIGWAARTELPNISEADLAAASQVATQVGSSAKDVVTAVEQIIGRSVQREETAALLTPPGTAPPSTAPPIATPTLPPNATGADIQAAITQLTTQLMQSQAAQSMTQQQVIAAATTAAQQWLSTQGIKAPPAAVEETTKATVTQAGGIGNVPLWLGGAALLFALARPAPRVRYRSSGRRRR
jgi:hypothetical protein